MKVGRSWKYTAQREGVDGDVTGIGNLKKGANLWKRDDLEIVLGGSRRPGYLRCEKMSILSLGASLREAGFFRRRQVSSAQAVFREKGGGGR